MPRPQPVEVAIVNERALLFGCGYVQVLLVALNTWQIANDHVAGAVIVGFLISLTWTFNVKRIAFGNRMDRFIYAGGAALGTLSGILLARAIY